MSLPIQLLLVVVSVTAAFAYLALAMWASKKVGDRYGDGPGIIFFLWLIFTGTLCGAIIFGHFIVPS